MSSKRLPVIFVAAALAVVLAACGMGGHHDLTGSWSASATANMSVMASGMASPMLSFTFNMAESPMQMANSSSPPMPSVSISNLNFANGSSCFDNMAMATATVTTMARNTRSLTLMLSENGNTAMFSMLVAPNNNSATGNFALTGGNMLRGATTSCMANASGTVVFTRQ